MEEYLKTFSEPVLGHEKPANIEFETPFPLLTVDLSKQTERHVIVASGTEEVYQGHPTTLALPGTSTIFCVWTLGHGGVCGPLKRSVDGGRSWSDYLPVPENWSQVKNCPVLYRLPDPDGRCRLFVFAGQGPDGKMHQATSEDNGETWNPMESNGLECVMPFCSILPVENGKKLLGLTNIRREQSDCEESYSNVLAQSFSEDGGFSWSPWRVILDHPDQKFCEPWLVPSPNGEQLVCLIRENCGGMSWYMTTEDEGRSWSEAQRMPVGLAGDRHVSRYAPDGRLVVVFRDRATNSETSGDFVAWVGHYEEIGRAHV